MALKILRRNHKSEVTDRTNIYETQQAQRKRVQEQIDNLTDKLSREIVEEDYIRQKNKLKAQLFNVDSGLRLT